MEKKTKPNKDDVIIEMEEAEDGTYHPIMPYRRPQINPPDQITELGAKISPWFQFLEGFIVGLEAMERFMRVTRKFSKDWFGK
jgi:hypothetical protein